MPLLQLWNDSRNTVLQMSIKQITATAGDGVIKDNSIASDELRHFLSIVPTKHLARYIETCLLDTFENSGFILQDIINELGKRLGYQVTSGRYRGSKKTVGFDGLWKIAGGRDIIIEAKTTDYYTINIDKIFKYKKQLIQSDDISPDAMVLFVVGRDDSNSLEAQIRGSRFAWDTRLISVEALLQMVLIKEKTQDSLTLEKIRALIEPIEYTRLDRLVNVVFLTIEDAEKSVEEETLSPDNIIPSQQASTSSPNHQPRDTSPTELIDEKRDAIAELFGKVKGVTFKKQRRVQFETTDGNERICVIVSKRYEKGQQIYWYAYHPSAIQYLMAAQQGYLLLGMMDREQFYAIPVLDMESIKEQLNTTNQENRHYWHLALYDFDGELQLALPKNGKRLSLAKYEINYSTFA